MHPSFEVLEHTADVGVRATGSSVEDVFLQATLGLLEITGTGAHAGPGERVDIEVTADDHGALLVDWLEEVLYLQDARDSVFVQVSVEKVDDGRARGWVEIVGRDRELEGTAVKAITYHQLDVSPRADGSWTATVYLDI